MVWDSPRGLGSGGPCWPGMDREGGLLSHAPEWKGRMQYKQYSNITKEPNR